MDAGHDAWIAALIGTVLELLIIFGVIHVIAKGYRTPRYVLPFMFALFLLQLFILTGTSRVLVTDQLLHEMPIHVFLIPLVLFGVFCCLLGARPIFRGGEVFYVLIIIGVALSIIPALLKIRGSEVLPMFDNGWGIINAVFKNAIFFESASFLLLFSGDIKVTKDFRKKFMIIASIVGALFVFFVFMTTAVFGPLAPMKSIAIVDLTTHSSFLTQGGKVGWLLVCIWLLLILLRFAVTSYCAFVCLRDLFGVKKFAGVIAITVAIALWAVWAFAVRTWDRLDVFLGYLPVSIIVVVFALLIPGLCLMRKRRAQNV